MTEKFFTFSVPQCERASVRGTGGCDDRHRFLCALHRDPPFRTCDKEIDDATWTQHLDVEIDSIISLINEEAVCKYASGLNGGRSCTISHPSRTGTETLMGAANYHARITFSSSNSSEPIQSWLMRIPHTTTFSGAIPSSMIDYLVVSEYTTLKFLEGTKVPTPRAFGYGLSAPDANYGDSSHANKSEKAKVWEQLADILVEIERFSFEEAGSLFLAAEGKDEGEEVEVEVGPVASDRFLVLTPRGLFDSSRECYEAWAKQYLQLIADGQLYIEYAVDAYLIYSFLESNIHHLLPAQKQGKREEDMFYLKHVDDKGDHILVDEEGNITGIIDWQMARIVPKSEAFGASLVSVDMGALCDGRVGLSSDDVVLRGILQGKGFKDVDEIIRDEKVRRFFWGLALEAKWEYALLVARGVLECFGVQESWEEWREGAMREYGGDERLQKLISSSLEDSNR